MPLNMILLCSTVKRLLLKDPLLSSFFENERTLCIQPPATHSFIASSLDIKHALIFQYRYSYRLKKSNGSCLR